MTDLIEVPFCDLCQQTKPGSLLGFDGQSMKWYGIMKGQLPRFLPYVHDLLRTVECVMHWMCQIQERFHSEDAWHMYWKKVSRDGYDVDKHDSCCVHVKMENLTLLSLFCVLSPYCKQCMTLLAQSIPCLHPEVCPETEHDMIIKADVIEILIAALRGHPDVAPMLVDS